jgi:hypothetical protein
MRRSKIALAAMAGLVAAAANAKAVPASDTRPSAENGGAAIQGVSDAALEQILEKSYIQLAGKKSWVQYSNPWPQWRGQFQQMRLPELSALPAPSGDVAAVFGSLKIS